MSKSLETVLNIENVRVKAYHGWYASERKIGGMYTISVNIYSTAAQSRTFLDIEDTINYEEIHSVIITTMKEEFKLIENCCKTLWDRLKLLSQNDVWEVSLIKEEVPIKHVGSTAFRVKG